MHLIDCISGAPKLANHKTFIDGQQPLKVRITKVLAFAFCEQRFKLQFHFLIRPRPGQTSMQSRIESTAPEAAHEKEIFN